CASAQSRRHLITENPRVELVRSSPTNTIRTRREPDAARLYFDYRLFATKGRLQVDSRHFSTLFFVVALCLPSISDAHRSGCHRWHSCPSDRGTYECGDSGHCSQCPDNKYCNARNPRTVERKPSQTPRPSQEPSKTPSR